MKYITILVVIVLFFVSCNKKTGRIKDKEVKSYQTKVIVEGDKYSYLRLLEYYDSQEKREELLPCCIIMANKYKDYDACYEILFGLISLYNKGKIDEELIVNLDMESQKLAFYYLHKGADKNDISCLNALENYYRNGLGISKDIKKANHLKIRLDSLLQSGKSKLNNH